MELISRDDAIKMIRGWFEIINLNPDILVDSINSLPITEIVQCKECKCSKIYALQSDAPMKRWCHNGHFPKEVTDDYYCGDGEKLKVVRL